jgi:hypothetical protein
MTTRITIDRIVLDGFDYGPRDRAAFEASLVAELSRAPEQEHPSESRLGRGRGGVPGAPDSLGSTVASAVRGTVQP